VHGETISEPVIPGTNRAAIEAGCDILAHPGMISKADAVLAKEKGVHLELTTRKNHSKPNKHVFKMAKAVGAKLVLDTDSHAPEDLFDDDKAKVFLKKIGLSENDVTDVFGNSEKIVGRISAAL
jgi:histidinol phosphatase-like PHP family hydrolase